MPTFAIDGRFNGPPGSANGGYACGLIAGALPGRHAVTLHAPVPLGTGLELREAGKRRHVWHGETLIATAVGTTEAVDAVAPVPPDEAEANASAYAGREGHPFPTCFACGVDRHEPDGLCLTPAPVADRPATVACTWEPGDALAGPDGRVPAEIVWSALDCPGGWTTDPRADPLLLGRMTATIDELPVPGRKYVVVAHQDSRTGRTAHNTSTLYDAGGTAIASASAIWVALAG
ncbi:hypothetical protein [Amycolatopsis sp. lyj-23]|uniref:hypothetical protein n=1 Tax=Amycolatopsis sp. lyj-23 TaxID=2789283 RepID=UPI00397A0C78